MNPMNQSTEHNIYSSFEATAQRRGHHTAIIYLGTKYSYLKVKELAERFAAALVDLGERQ
jgi:acyl-CoA synthetase (AMP-forming)/AMP-acid ligase II